VILVPRDAREGEVGPLPVDRETVTVAHTADFDADADLTPRRFGCVALDEFKRAASLRNLHCPHLCHRRLLSRAHKSHAKCSLPRVETNLLK
jgi:hypothetical protein